MTATAYLGNKGRDSWEGQIENRNFLSPIGFKFVLSDYPKVTYFAQTANIPGISINQVEQPTQMGRSIPWDSHGIEYEPLNLQFLIDEDLENYLILHNWMRGMSVGRSFSERTALEDKSEERMLTGKTMTNIRSDGSLAVLNSNFQTNFFVTFENMFPVSLSALEFNATIDGTEYAVAQASFRYDVYDIQDTLGQRRTNLS